MLLVGTLVPKFAEYTPRKTRLEKSLWVHTALDVYKLLYSRSEEVVGRQPGHRSVLCKVEPSADGKHLPIQFGRKRPEIVTTSLANGIVQGKRIAVHCVRKQETVGPMALHHR